MSADLRLEGAEVGQRERRVVLVIALVAAILRLAIFLTMRPWQADVVTDTILIGDATGYHNLALGVMRSGSFELFGAGRTPGYPLFLAGIYSVVGVRPWAVLLAQVFIGSASVLLVHRWARLAVGASPAVLAAALFALEPLSLSFTVTLLTDTLFVFIFLASMLALVKGIKSEKIGQFVVSGALLGIATLVRPISQFFPAVAAGIVLFHRRIRWPFRLKAAAVVVVVSVLAISPWVYRNHAVYGYAELSSMRGRTLLYWSATSMKVVETGKTREEVRAEFQRMAFERGADLDGNPFDNSKIYEDIAMTYIRSNFGAYVARHWKGIEGTFLNVSSKAICEYLGLPTNRLPFSLFTAPGRGEMIRKFLEVRTPHEIAVAGVLGVYALVTYVSALGASVLLLRRRKFAPVIIPLAVIAYFCLLIGTVAQPRYKLPMVPFYITLSGLGLLEFRRLVTARRRRRMVL